MAKTLYEETRLAEPEMEPTPDADLACSSLSSRLAEPEMEPTPDSIIVNRQPKRRLAEPEMEPTPDVDDEVCAADGEVS